MKVVRHGPLLDKIYASVTENKVGGVSSAVHFLIEELIRCCQHSELLLPDIFKTSP